eukprot:6212179-Pyramimonas_sp.AAC.1
MPPPLHWHTPHTFRGLTGAPPKAPVDAFTCCPPPLYHTPHTLRGPIGSSTQGPSGCVHMPPALLFGKPLK